jgi:Fe-S-cluster containining protein
MASRTTPAIPRPRPPSRSRARPLRVRPGARYACHGDGLCCADAHLLGPVSSLEARAIAAHRPDALLRDQGFVMLRTQRDGTCVFLTRAARCSIHELPIKPRTCHRYPFLLVATPDGGRIATDHRCPCRTMGMRPLLRAEDAEPALRDVAGRISVDHRVELPIALGRGRAIDWPGWRALEAELLERLAGGEAVESVLDIEPFPDFADGSWLQIGVDLADDDRPMRWTCASQWAGDTIATLHGAPPSATARPRPWRDVFDRAEARSPESDPEAILADWIADSIWSLEWTGRGTFALARADLATRTAIVRAIAARLTAGGARRDRATAEAISVCEIVGLSDAWSSLLGRVAL